ncbi:MAG: 5-(carboxyamino)imidazole ribonucleotide synthase [Saprospiraceae bacterium]|nr:5-(carboxyamino)imidazole ribonucleotide synthase [Saprospiraceae bacterium]
MKKIAVLGGGQLGLMMIRSAIDFNIEVAVLDPNPEAPCAKHAAYFEVGDLNDFDTVYNFGKKFELITIEIEQVNTKALHKLSNEGIEVYPQPHIIEMIQDKRIQKQFYEKHNIPTSPFILTDSLEDILTKSDFLPAVNKIGKGGYDGKGVQIMRNAEDLKKGFDAPGLMEKLIDFQKEIAVIVARNKKGEIKAFPPVELVFHPTANLVEFLLAPAQISVEISKKAIEIATNLTENLSVIGLLAVEMFVTKEGEVLVNEIAPRTHNSGHQSIESNMTSQFEQHLRAILNWPLGDTSLIISSAMINLLGEEGHIGPAICEGLEDVLKVNGCHMHLYGKKITKPFRKMGHVTVRDKDINELKNKIDFVKKTIKFISNE